MRVLIIADEVWNDEINGNNILTNWFKDFPAEFAEIYCSPGSPNNSCCKSYFQLTDTMMVKSYWGKKAGSALQYDDYPVQSDENIMVEEENQSFYRFMKSIAGEILRTIREIIWCTGRYDIEKIEEFIDEFKPDIVFCPRLSSHKLLRLEGVVQKITQKPMIAFTGDDEYSLENVIFNPIYWGRKILLRKKMRKQIPSYSLYYTHSKKQAQEYYQLFGIPTKTLFKCGEFKPERIHKQVNQVLKIVYIGKLYCNRWKTLEEIGNAIRDINGVKQRMILEIYTQDKISATQKKALNDGKNVVLKGAISPNKIQSVYDQADIVLHVESFDIKNKLITKYSFSTKIIDCLSSGCALMAVCWEKQAGFQYLREQDAAMTASNPFEIKKLISEIANNPGMVLSYAERAYECGMKNHRKNIVQRMMLDDFEDVLND